MKQLYLLSLSPLFPTLGASGCVRPAWGKAGRLVFLWGWHHNALHQLKDQCCYHLNRLTVREPVWFCVWVQEEQRGKLKRSVYSLVSYSDPIKWIRKEKKQAGWRPKKKTFQCLGTMFTYLKFLRFLLVVGSRAREAKMSSKINSLCFSYREKIWEEAHPYSDHAWIII